MRDAPSKAKCRCGKEADRILSMPAITGTRDSFGIGRNFIHEGEGGRKEITTWREWEKAGYREAKEVHKGTVKEMIKRKEDKMKHSKGRPTVSV